MAGRPLVSGRPAVPASARRYPAGLGGRRAVRRGQGEGTPLAGAGGCALLKVVIAPVGLVSVT
jgi:hypothetical protein